MKPASIGDVLKDVFSRLDEERVAITKEDIDLAWKNLAGDTGFKHSKAMTLRRGVLTVFVDSSPWLQELSIRKRTILKGLKRMFGKDKISEIHFKIGEI